MASNNSLTIASPKEVFKLARYSTNLGQTLTDAVQTDISFNTAVFTDTHVTQTSGTLFTINEDGFYEIEYRIRITQAGTASNAQFQGSGVAVNGVTVVRAALFTDIGSPSTGTQTMSGALPIIYKARLSAGDTIVGWALNDNSSNINKPLITDSTYNYIVITKMGE